MNTIKLIIFDMDGTLYNLDDVVEMNYQIQIDFFMTYTGKLKEQVIKEFEENNIFPTITEKSKSATEFFARSGIPVDEWNNYRDAHFDVSFIKRESAIQSWIIEKYTTIARLVLLTSNSLRNIQKILLHIGVNKKDFSEIVCSDKKLAQGPFNKKNEIICLGEYYGIKTSNIFSIGDRYKTDIEPIIELGGQGALVKSPKDIITIYDAIKKGDYSSINYFCAKRII